MSRTRIAMWAIGVVAVIAIVAGVVAYREFVGVEEQFDVELYAAAAPAGGKAFSYDDYAAILSGQVDSSGMVHYAGLKADRGRLDEFARAMGRLDRKQYDSWGRKAKIAFWINAYNALTLKAIIDNYPIRASLLRSVAYPASSIRQIPGVWDKIHFLVMARKMTLNEIEHDMLRAEFDEPRIHVALVCAAMGCPALRNEPYTGGNLDQQLDDQASKFLADPAKFKIDRDAGVVHLSSVFKWFGDDFKSRHLPADGFLGHSDAERAVLKFASGHVATEDAGYLPEGSYRIKYLKYEWSLNERKFPIIPAGPTRPATRPVPGK